MKFRVGFSRRIVGRETVECIIQAEDLEDAEAKFDAEDFVSYLVTERIFDDSDIIVGPTIVPVQEVEVEHG